MGKTFIYISVIPEIYSVINFYYNFNTNEILGLRIM